MSNIIKESELPGLIGQELEPSAWLEITQERVNQFADATNDHQFIHVDAEKASQTPFGGTIAHGFLSLSLLIYLNSQNAKVPENLAAVINYGSDKVRYLTPVKVGQRIRSLQTVTDIVEKSPGNWLVKTATTVEIEGESKPAMIAELILLLITKQ